LGDANKALEDKSKQQQDDLDNMEEENKKISARLERLEVDQKPFELSLSEEYIKFALGRADIPDLKSETRDMIKERIIDKLYQAYKSDQPCRLMIIGHTDKTGDFDDNAILGLNRARSMKAKLEEFGKECYPDEWEAVKNHVDVVCVSAGQTKPSDQSTGADDCWQDRRIEIFFFPRGK
jgi:outer membrane protein OmpA-like peptidoglycan-associated protein